MEDSSSSRLGVHVSSRDLELVQSGDEAKERMAWDNIRMACLRYIQRWGPSILESHEDDIVDEAIIENIGSLLSFYTTPDEASKNLSRSLNRHRARWLREAARYAAPEAIPDIVDNQQSDEFIHTEFLRGVLQVVRPALEAGLLALSDRDYSLMVSEYDLPEVATRNVDRSVSSLSREVFRVALFRARHRFLKTVEKFLSGAETENSQQSRDIFDTALKVFRVGDLSHLSYLTSDKIPKERPGSKAYYHAASTVSPPAFSIIWDPEVVTEAEYLELASALGDLVRSEGGLGIQIIDSSGLAINVPAEVLV
jgi:hypothetical protein